MGAQLCPACRQSTLIVALVSGQPSLRCQRCGGFLMDYKAMKKIAPPEDAVWQAFHRMVQGYLGRCHFCGGNLKRGDRSCPSCGYHFSILCHRHDVPMLGATFGHLKVDYCSECRDVWFDAQEMAEVAVRSGWMVWDGVGPIPPEAQAHVNRARRLSVLDDVFSAVVKPLNNLFRS